MAGCHSEVRLANDIFYANNIYNRRTGKLAAERRGAEKVFLCTSVLCSLGQLVNVKNCPSPLDSSKPSIYFLAEMKFGVPYSLGGFS